MRLLDNKKDKRNKEKFFMKLINGFKKQAMFQHCVKIQPKIKNSNV